ncbi:MULTISPECIES: LacI family DNA-binding transcriptional regulator [unclassified Actinobaculum]|uniref:LacI family DNA-binding transcriptional regulator n=1 Tax=unclassified Actinobaculum TaxID=2609299 RepID=UPI000D528678|nr:MULTISPECIES: LacI family DNA-binding transcriptional regulator [unclassified Actinobaculum]AWE42492.1 LacI family transcriptional regulator [Actinobaculum sp. 313]RTE48717.1 LacI family transcriptional regulator [Actinobaculum sp. 352]
MGRVRLKDVAEKSGVSIGTVSRVLNNTDSRIAKDTVARVQQAARDLGYTPNATAQSLRTSRSNMLAALTDTILTTPFAHQLLHGAQDVAWDSGYLLITLGTEDKPDQRIRAYETLVAHQIDGLLVGAMYHRPIDLGDIKPIVPMVCFNGVLADPAYTSFAPDDRQGAVDATELLVRAGHRNILHITEKATDGLARDLRVDGFRTVTKANGIQATVVETRERSDRSRSQAAEEAAYKALVGPNRPTAIFAFSDLMALGVLRAARSLGLSVPEDLSVIGYDDQEHVANESFPPLTTVRLPHAKIGALAARELLVQLSAMPGQTHSGTIYVPCPLIVRDSVSSPPAL